MKPDQNQREVIRVSMVKYIAAGEGAMSTNYLLQYIRNEGFKSVDLAWMKEELRYVAAAGLIAEVQKLMSPENKHWEVTKAGRDYLAETGNE